MWVLYGLVAAWLAQLAGSLFFTRSYLVRLASPGPSETEPPVTVIAPIKGVSRHLDPFLDRLLSFRYSDYRVIASVETADDPALERLRARGEGTSVPLKIVIAGRSTTEGQKVHNMRAALAALDDRCRIVAFIDADTAPEADWLSRVVRPLAHDPAIAAVSGNRWIEPADTRLASRVVAAANQSIVTVPRLWTACWGGTLALRRATIEELDLPSRMAGAVVDDVNITRILDEAGLTILNPRGLLVRCPAEHDWGSAFAFGRRQYMFVRMYVRHLWLSAIALLALPVVGALSAFALLVAGSSFGVVALLLALVAGVARSALRARIARRIWGSEGRSIYDRQASADRWLVWLWAPFHLAVVLSAGFGRVIRWAGIEYRVDGRNETRILSRR